MRCWDGRVGALVRPQSTSPDQAPMMAIFSISPAVNFSPKYILPSCACFFSSCGAAAGWGRGGGGHEWAEWIT